MSPYAIEVNNLGKTYQVRQARQGYKTLQEEIVGWVKRPFAQRHTPQDNLFWALRDVSFTLKEGEVLGVIGRNGAGKSTLLKILSRITKPSTGTARIVGRVGSLLEVGTGFHPELTGRENIFLNGAILGMSRRDIRQRFDEIVQFAEVERFLDTPVKRYSSGMYMRLAFSVAAHLEPDVLIVDEVLAVGDAEFQRKSLGKMSDVAREGRTVLFVSHNMGAVQALCHRCLWLQQGKVAGLGETQSIISQYLNLDSSGQEWRANEGYSAVKNPYFNPTRIYLVDEQHQQISREISAAERFGVAIEGQIEKLNSALTVGFAVLSASGDLLFWSLQTDVEQAHWPPLLVGFNRIIGWIPPHLLNEGDYRIELILSLHYQEWLSQPGDNAPIIDIAIRGGLSKSPYWMVARPGLIAPILQFESQR